MLITYCNTKITNMADNQSFINALELFDYTDTLRSIFDNHSFEYQSATNEFRIIRLRKIINANIELDAVLKGYIEFYNIEKPQVSKNFIPSAICFINKNLNQKYDPYKKYSFKFLIAKLKEILYE